MKAAQHLLFIFAVSIFCYSCAKDTGTVTVTYQEATAIYGDLEAVRQLPLKEQSREINNPGKIYIGQNYILIGEEGEGVHVIDNNNRTSPSSSAFISIPGNREFIVIGDFLYAESYYDVVKIDVSDPKEPQLVGRALNAIQEELTNEIGETVLGFSYETKTIELDETDDFFTEIIGDQLVYKDFANNIIPNSAVPTSFAGNSQAQSGTVNRLALHKQNLYVISNNNITVVSDQGSFGNEVSKQQSPVEDMETIFSHEDLLFVGSRTAMSIFEASENGAVDQVSSFDHATSCDPVLPHEDVAYVTLRTGDFSECPGNINAMLVIDVSRIDRIHELEEINMSSPYGMSIIGDQLYVGQGNNGLEIYDISNPRKPEHLNSVDIEAFDIIADPVNADFIFIAGPNQLSQFKIGDTQSFDMQSQIGF